MQHRHVVLHCSDSILPGCDLQDNAISSGRQPENRHQKGWLMIWTTGRQKTRHQQGHGGWESEWLYMLLHTAQSLSVLHHRKKTHYFLTSSTSNWIISTPYFLNLKKAFLFLSFSFLKTFLILYEHRSVRVLRYEPLTFLLLVACRNRNVFVQMCLQYVRVHFRNYSQFL